MVFRESALPVPGPLHWVCTGSAPHVQLICPCSAIGLHLVRTEGTRERLFLYASLTCPVSLLLSDCHGFVLSGLFEYLH